MEANYYKGLDTKSNSIRIREKKKLINKNIILELRKCEENKHNTVNRIRVIDTISRYLGPKKEPIYFHV